ncbi:Predicted dehydrogenase [Chitinophaga costaii]|uniref:Predicted dehydrogenase n=1 Tax=Chitinophaga costaii TaxID=1335309 RepID=A0A1C4E0J6_9BACT|nr:Gfo/Idh/MocA family oxidoreductase [Chitinophaga costaii]PUZ24388.1 gfo/Idh/MocA family oxidoreductase [Chitinophaga costaii]SCC37124.1 Predicted dehydrogenase [Chitinophaga costaii]
MCKKSFTRLLLLAGFSLLSGSLKAQSLLNVVVAGLNHDHIHNILHAYKAGQVNIIGIAEPDKALQQRFAKTYHLPDSLFYSDLKTALVHEKPDAVLGYNAVGHHLDVIQLCAPMGIPVMVEKPLAATLAQAQQIQALANKYKVKVLTNYETTWYASYFDLYKSVQADSIGGIKKMVVHDGHQGPKEIGCSEAFLSWLTDPALNGAGALNDFGCYGADLMTWFTQGQRPLAVTAITRHYKPAVYPKVDDDATILIEYPSSTGLIEASWNWPFAIKDLEVFGETGYLHALDGTHLYKRQRENKVSVSNAPPLPTPINDPMVYLAAVLHGELPGTDDLSSLRYNMIVMEILDAAKRSAATGKRIVL